MTSTPNPTISKRGFTLIELLVVIAIIAILAAILFPVFAQARAAARADACLSNISQIGAVMYVQDYDEALYPYRFSDVNYNPCKSGYQVSFTADNSNTAVPGIFSDTSEAA